MLNRLLQALLLLLVTVPVAHAVEVGGVDVPDTASPADSVQILYLNGAGIREKLFLDIYVGALYLPETTGDVKAILNDERAASVHMYILHSKISREKIVGAWHDGLESNLDETGFRSIEPDLAAFSKLFTDVHKGDVIRIDYLPGTGTTVLVNGNIQGTVPGNRFFRALLRVWLGDSPVSRSLKKAMLGG